ncbi:MAG: transcription antitermination factor NusB [Acidimicrobiales bacterium]
MPASPDVALGGRRLARERAVCLLYEAEAKGIGPGELLAELPAPPDPYAGALVRGVGDHFGRIDALLAGRAIGWTLERMPALDRNILRVGAYEMMCCPDVPTAVVISQAVELAKQYSTEESGKWVNGVLAALVGDVRPAEAPSPDGGELAG